MAIANVSLSDTFDNWRIRTNELIITVNQNDTKLQFAYDTANTANVTANSAFDTANLAFINSNSGYEAANASHDTANSAFFKANDVGSIVTALTLNVDDVEALIAIPAFARANTANGTANSAFDTANLAYNHANTANSNFTASNILNRIVTVDGTGSGLDADLLDGEQGSYYSPLVVSQYAFVKGNVAHLTANSAFAKANLALPSSSYTASDVLSKLLTVDGSASGLDADLLDGEQGSYYRNASNLNAGTVPSARLSGSYTITASDATLAAKAATLGNGGGSGNSMTFNWSGLSGQPLWLWGSNDGNNHYVWNPANFSVNYATNAGLLDSVDSTSFLRSDISDVYSGGVLSINSQTAVDITNTGQIEGLQIFQPTPQADALISFHVAADVACHFGLSGDDNQLCVGGWSLGGVKYRIWHEGNDGSASGLDADLLDGYHASSFALLSGAASFSGTLSGSSSSYYGIMGTSSYTYGVYGKTTNSGYGGVLGYNYNNTAYGILGHAASYSFYGVGNIENIGYIYANSGSGGEVRATGDIIAFYSDKRLKENIVPIENAMSKLSKLNGIYYTQNDLAKSFGYDDGDVQIGVLAQEVQKVVPSAVTLAPFDIEMKDGKKVSKSGENYLTVKYEKLIPLLIEAIKEQQKEIELLKSKVGE